MRTCRGPSASNSPRKDWKRSICAAAPCWRRRAAGRDFPLVGLWQDLNDPAGARRFAEQNRALGFRGQVLIHPSHAPSPTRCFTPSAQAVAFYAGMIEAFERAEAAGIAAISYEGHHIDYAHVKTAREVLAMHKALTLNDV